MTSTIQEVKEGGFTAGLDDIQKEDEGIESEDRDDEPLPVSAPSTFRMEVKS